MKTRSIDDDDDDGNDSRHSIQIDWLIDGIERERTSRTSMLIIDLL